MIYKLPEYHAGLGMKQRCFNVKNKRYVLYGARGITVCKRWMSSFNNFISDMGYRPSDKHSIERINNDGNYTPYNCKWAIHKEQCNNRRNTVRYKYKNRNVTMSYLMKISGFKQATLWVRIHKIGMSVEDAVNRPVRTNIGLLINGVKYKNIWHISKEKGINDGTLRNRLKKMSLEDAVNKPLNGKHWTKKKTI